jgi:selT/selW/selH-like putative selenoprotein
MKVSIEYCGTCNYRPMAASLAKAIEVASGMRSVLIHSRTIGAFEVTLGDETIYSKMKSRQFPDNEKIAEIIRQRLIDSGRR